MKKLYVVYDSKSKEFGEILQFNNDEEAKRAFIHTIFMTPKAFRDDLQFYLIGEIDLSYTCKILTPVLDSVITPVLKCCSVDEDIVEEVRKKERARVEENTIYAQIQAKIQEKLNSKFFENLEIVSNYLTASDSYSTKSFKKAMKKAMKDAKKDGK